MKKTLLLILQFIPIVLSLLVIGAHFMREGLMGFVLVSLLLLISLFFRRPLVARVVQVALILASVEWVITAYQLMVFRLKWQLPWLRMILILSGVALVTFASAFLFQTQTMKAHYKMKDEGGRMKAEG
ncbi:MAG: hypothetical protein D6675_09970 [Gemmatimonadetes bacterium]|nr:MAG: hypothetical protein D6675_09970 [Gemmatimonadota bacterium]